MRFEQKYIYLIGMVTFGVIALMGVLNLFYYPGDYTIFSKIGESFRSFFYVALSYMFYYLYKTTKYAPGTEINEEAIEEFLKNDSETGHENS